MSDFALLLKEYLEQLSDLRARGASEDTIRDAFLGFLRKTFPRLRSGFEPILLEKHIPGLRARGGFADALYTDLIFEFKRSLDDANRKDGMQKLKLHLLNQLHPEHFFGILTEGKTLEAYLLRNGDLVKTDELHLDVETADRCKLWLDCYLFHERLIRPTAEDVVRRFGESSPTFWHSLRILQELWRKTKTEPSAQTKFAEWQSLLAIVYGSSVGDEELFLRHTYLALFARILAFVSVERRAPTEDEVSGIMTGETFEQMGFDNFAGDDFFAWASDAADLLRSLAVRLASTYDLSAIREDLLKELYQELVDPQTRHDLGEFYTPDWLAELTLRQAGFPASKASLLDPACGSGTFLFAAVRLLRENGFAGERLVEFCADSLAGMDVHPLAVTIAKTNLVLALGDDLRQSRRRFRLPVYMADALMTPQEKERAVPVPVDTDAIAKRARKPKEHSLPSSFWLPTKLADHPETFHAAVDALLDFAAISNGGANIGRGFEARLKELGAANDEDLWLWHANLQLMRWLLREPATDTVWRFVLHNAYQPELFARRKFTFVVGNPPWLSYRFIQRPDYQKRVRELTHRYGLLEKSQKHLFPSIDLSTLFFALCSDRYVADGGTLAFVMPRNVLAGAKQHANFRTRFVADARCLIDCEMVFPLFNVPACVLIWGKPPKTAQKANSALRLENSLPRKNASLAEAEAVLIKREFPRPSPKARRGSPYLGRVVKGAVFSPRCLWFVSPPRNARIVDEQRPQLETDSKIKTNAKQPWKEIRLKGKVEAEFLFATLLSDDLLPFGWRSLSLVVLPIILKSHPAFENQEEIVLIDKNHAVSMGKTGLASWLNKAEMAWIQHRKSPVDLLDYLNWQDKLTRQHASGVWKLLYNETGTHLCACVVNTSEVKNYRVYGLPVRGFVADTKTYWIETNSSDEAYFLCAVLNAPEADKAIKPHQTKGSYGLKHGKGERDIHRRPFEVLPIPLYNSTDKRHLRLAQLSRECHMKVAEFAATAEPDVLMQPVGKLRQQIRQDLLPEELAEIDALTAEILQNHCR